MGLLGVLQPFSHFLAKMAARAASIPRCLYREDVKLYTTLGLFGVLQPFSHLTVTAPLFLGEPKDDTANNALILSKTF